MNKIIGLLLTALLAVVLMMTGCGQDQGEPIDSPEPIGGLIYAIDGNGILVVGGINEVNIPREEWFEAGNRAVYFAISADTTVELKGNPVSAERLARGQKVDVFHEGFLAESYPEQGGALLIVIVDDTAAEEFHTDSGRFVGRIENDLVEIKISGVPDELPGRLFRLTAEAQNHLNRLELEAEEDVIFKYLPDEDYEGLIFDLNRIIN